MHRQLLSALVGDEEIEDLLSDETQLRWIVALEIAPAELEGEAGLISQAAAVAIAQSISDFAPDWVDLAKGMARDGVVPTLLRQMRQAIGAKY